MGWATAAHTALILVTAVAAGTITVTLWNRAAVLREMPEIGARVRLPEELVADTRIQIGATGVAQYAYRAAVRFVSNPVGWAKLRVIAGTEPYLRRLFSCWIASSSLIALSAGIVWIAWQATWWWLLGLLPLLVARIWVDAVQSDTNVALLMYSNAFDRLLSDEEWVSSEAAAQARSTLEVLAQQRKPS